MTELDPSLSGVLLSYAAFLLAMASPGPNVLAVIGTSMGGGRASGVALALGVAAGSLGSGVLTVLGLSALLASYAHALTVIKIAGGVFLLWLAFKAFRSAASAYDIEAAELAGGRRTPAGYALRGLTIQMTNPKAAIAWIAIVSLGLTDGAPSWVGAAIVGGCFVLSVALHLAYTLAFSTPVMVRLNGRARRAIQAALGAFFGLAGLRLLLAPIADR